MKDVPLADFIESALDIYPRNGKNVLCIINSPASVFKKFPFLFITNKIFITRTWLFFFV